MRRLIPFLVALLFATPAVGAPAGARVYGASSMTEALSAIADAYAATGRPRPVLVFGASSALSRQIERGAPPGVLVSADTEWPDFLAKRGLTVKGSQRLIAGNRLVVVVPRDQARTVRIAPGFDLGTLTGARGRWTTGDPDAVPVGRYAKAALIRLGGWSAAQPRLARAENVRSALAYVERGDVAAGIVYATDAKASGKVAVAATFPAATHPPIVYPAVLTRGADAEARAFHAFLTSRRARTILDTQGFRRP